MAESEATLKRRTDFDSVLSEIGYFGRYQKIHFILVCLPVFFAAAHGISYVFLAGVPNYRCFIQDCDNPINPIFNQTWTHNVVPGTIGIDGILTPDQCNMFDRINRNDSQALNAEDVTMCSSEEFSSQVSRCNQWVFDDERTIVSDWLITCPENEWLLALVGTLHFAGYFVGSATMGFLADRYGRKKIYLLCSVIMGAFGIGQALAKDYVTFSIFIFLNAIGTAGTFLLCFIIGLEMVGPKERGMIGIVINYFCSIGSALVGLIAWLSKDWIILAYAISAPPLLFIIYYWIIHESPRWLLAQNRIKEAARIINKAASINGVVLSDDVANFLNVSRAPRDNHKMNVAQATPQDQNEKIKIGNMFIGILKSNIMLLRCAILFYNWTAISFTFYGLSLHSVSLNGNKYLNFILVCLIEIPGLTVTWIAMNKIGRHLPLSISLIICALSCIGGAFVGTAYVWLQILLYLIGKMGVTAAFAIIYVISTEVLPTIVRSGGVGAMSTVARVGTLVAPFVPLLNRFYEPLPLLVFGIVSLLAGLLSLFLPETLGHTLPETIEEAELIGKQENKRNNG